MSVVTGLITYDHVRVAVVAFGYGTGMSAPLITKVKKTCKGQKYGPEPP